MNDTADTKTRILDSAEKLFGLKGIEDTSLRDITAHAQVNLAAVNYHFQSKDSLVDSVIARRIEPVNRRRLELLDAAGPEPTVEQILTAFLTPPLEIRLESVVPLLGRILSNPNLFLDRVYKRHFALISERFRAALGKALPDLSRRELLWRQMFMVGSMTHVMVLGQILPAVTEGVCDISDPAELVGHAVRFLAAGFRAPSEGAAGRATAGKKDAGQKEMQCAG
jgi:AcrR family transcriptional regulator